jgi:hypothetical protein
MRRFDISTDGIAVRGGGVLDFVPPEIDHVEWIEVHHRRRGRGGGGRRRRRRRVILEILVK